MRVLRHLLRHLLATGGFRLEPLRGDSGTYAIALACTAPPRDPKCSSTSSSGACVADCVSIERALRCLVALGVPMRVRAQVAEAAHNAAAGASKVIDLLTITL